MTPDLHAGRVRWFRVNAYIRNKSTETSCTTAHNPHLQCIYFNTKYGHSRCVNLSSCPGAPLSCVVATFRPYPRHHVSNKLNTNVGTRTACRTTNGFKCIGIVRALVCAGYRRQCFDTWHIPQVQLVLGRNIMHSYTPLTMLESHLVRVCSAHGGARIMTFETNNRSSLNLSTLRDGTAVARGACAWRWRSLNNSIQRSRAKSWRSSMRLVSCTHTCWNMFRRLPLRRYDTESLERALGNRKSIGRKSWIRTCKR